MAGLLAELLQWYDLCIISGTGFESVIYPNTVSKIEEKIKDIPGADLSRLHIMPTCGTRYYRYENGAWQLQYQEDLTEEQKARIFAAIETSAKELDMWEADPAGEIIEDRLSQITYSALGQFATPEAKYAWAEANKEKRKLLNDAVKARIPEFEATGAQKEEILFFGDKLEEGGNDFPVRAMGVDCIAVERWEDTAYALEGIRGVNLCEKS
jgi:hypothetical protein